jgi:hypothetical protein
MIQLNDITCTVINPLHIIYFNVSSNPLEPDFKELSELTGQMTIIEIGEKDFTIVGEIKCIFNYQGLATFKYVSVEAFESDYRKLLRATNA